MKTMINEIAERCGMTPMAVRKILRAEGSDISPETFQQVVESARELGYDFSGEPSGSLAILYAEKSGKGLTHPFFISILNAFKNEAEAQGFGGPVHVTVTVTENEIVDVAITGDQETPALGGVAVATMGLLLAFAMVE